MSDIVPAALLEALPIGCVIVDATGAIRQANTAAAARLRRTTRGLLGENFFETFGLPDGGAAFTAKIRSGDPPAEVKLDLDVPDAVVRVRGFTMGGVAYAAAVFEPAHADVRMRRVAQAWEEALEIVREVRHEINNPLMGIMGQVELLQARKDLPPPVAHKIASIEHESARIRAMTARLGTIKRV